MIDTPPPASLPTRTSADLLGAARAIGLKWPILWLPPILINALQGLAGGPFVSSSSQALVGITANIGAFMIGAGWLAMIGKALAGEDPRFEDFNRGVNERWLHIVIGNVAFVAVLAGTLAAAVFVGEQRYGLESLRAWYQPLMELPADKVQDALQQRPMPVSVQGWMTVLTGWLASAVALSFLLLFWQPLAVLRGLPWWVAWWESARLVGRRMGQVLTFGGLHAAGIFCGLAGAMTGNPVLSMCGLTLFLFVTIYFKILYAAVVDDARPRETPAMDVHA